MKTTPGEESISVLCEDALVEILVRLPSESVLRCRAVCRLWRRLATAPSFLAAHAAHAAARRAPEMIIIPQFLRSAIRTMALHSDNDLRGRFLYDCTLRSADGTLLGWHDLVYSLRGLLVLRQHEARYVIVNPTTRQSTSLPVLAPDPCFEVNPCGFYFHASSNEYRLLCHCLVKEQRPNATGMYALWDRDRCFYVLSAGATILPPRRLMGCRAPAPPHDPSLTRYEVPVAHRHSLHWFSRHPEASATGKMLAFHTASETFRLMARPPERQNTWASSSRALFELDDIDGNKKLGVADLQGDTSLDVWVLQDYEAERWALHHRVEVPPPAYLGSTSKFFTMTMVIPLASGSGIVLMGDPCCYVARLYNLRERRMHRDVFFGPESPAFLVFTESLVPHAFFQSPNPYAEDFTPICFR